MQLGFRKFCHLDGRRSCGDGTEIRKEETATVELLMEVKMLLTISAGLQVQTEDSRVSS